MKAPDEKVSAYGRSAVQLNGEQECDWRTGWKLLKGQILWLPVNLGQWEPSRHFKWGRDMIRFPSLKEPSGHSTQDAGNGSQRVREGAVKPSSELVAS